MSSDSNFDLLKMVKPEVKYVPFYLIRPIPYKTFFSQPTLALLGNLIILVFTIALITCIIFKAKIGAKSKAELMDAKDKTKFNPSDFDIIFNNWTQTMIMFLGLDIGGAIASFTIGGVFDWWSILVGGCARNLIFLLFNILKVYFLQYTAIAV